MCCTRHDPIPTPIANEVVAVLRHDLVTPINLIVGYCDLMIGEADDLGQTERLAPLRSIRNYGFTLLHLIDRSLLVDQSKRSVADVRDLGQSLNEPATTLLEACDVLRLLSSEHEAESEFDEDLQKVRSAAVQMIIMAHQLASGKLLESFHTRSGDRTDNSPT